MTDEHDDATRPAPLRLPFPVAVNRHFRGKLRPGGRQFWQFNMSFANEQLTLDELLGAITAGHAWTAPHRHVRHRRPTPSRPRYRTTYRVKANVIESQLLALDSDTGDERSSFAQLLADPFINRHATLIHSTASSTWAAPRSRVIFLLDEPLAPQEYELALRALLERYSFCDQSVKHAAAVFYGAQDCAYCRLNRLLPVAVLREELLAPYEARQTARRQQRLEERERRRAAWEAAGSVRASPDQVTRYVAHVLDAIGDELAAIPSGQGRRHEELFSNACRLGQLQAAPWLSEEARRHLQQGEALLLQAAEANGYLADYGLEDALRAVEGGLEIGQAEPAEEPFWYPEPERFEIGDRVEARTGERPLGQGQIDNYRYREEEGRWEYGLAERPKVWFAGELLTRIG